MAKKSAIVVGIAVAVVAVSIAYGAIANPGGEVVGKPDQAVWNLRFSGSDDYENLINGSIGYLEKGYYKIGFVPMGDSPNKIRIIIGEQGGIYETQGIGKVLDELYILDRDLVDTGISKYYTWEYNGDKSVFIPKDGSFFAYKIIPEGNLEGSVSISLTKMNTSI
tara:strand:- start:41 stop:535 length:495 start_codon:yes stop_codon:yes gene_type:complete